MDDFKNYQTGLQSPPDKAQSVTPNDGADLPTCSRALNVATAGTVHLTTTTGEEVTLYIAAGILFPIRAARIFATGTTAEGIVALC